MLASGFRLLLIFLALSFCLPTQSSAAALRGRGLLPAVRAKLKGQHHVHRPNYRAYRPARLR
ncbi:hypothetical protein HNQ93_001917 [Hymenobacter luteus]|uniref:Uncharacterized protein n=2 Tax=Hymenobacter TaxID=89966 RepID=A0A7W9T001_9BACT|nr:MULTISPECIES: hypothetical protein [Hymenobacter]MBB4600722.1 hypothetical protein [Hymenobacter latericoloratus]MBB6059071.1 hypothetical protein [Hymenobacter luteus]